MADLTTIESLVLTNLKYGIDEEITTRYPTLTVTSEPSTKEPIFPNIYVQELEGMETGTTLENKNMNGLITTIQIQVSTNSTKADCKKIAWASVDVLKGMRFSLTSSPIYSKKADVHQYVFRARRTLCAGDNL